MSARDERDSEVESDVANENVTKPEHARRAFTSPFVHLVKRRIAVPSKARHEKLKKAEYMTCALQKTTPVRRWKDWFELIFHPWSDRTTPGKGL